MSRSSAASRPSSDGSSRFAALAALADLPFLAATREALPWSFGGLLAAFIVLLFALPVPGPVFSQSLGLRVAGALLPSFGVMGLVLAPVLGWRYAVHTGLPAAPAIAAPLLAYAIALPPFHGNIELYLKAVGSSGLFLAMIAGGVFAFAAYVVRNGWVAAGVVVICASAARAAHLDLSAHLTMLLQPLGMLGDTYVALVLIVVIETLLWLIGIHGPALLAAVVTPVYLTLQMQNVHAYAAHEPLPLIVVVSLFLFIFPGGAGSTLPLAALLALSRVPRLRTIGRATIVPSFFNTNEPLLFSLPVVLNPFFALPFVAVPVVLATSTYLAVSHGLVGRAIYYVPSSIPTVISTYIATLDIRAVLLSIVNIAIATVLYLPFVRAYERHALAALKAAA